MGYIRTRNIGKAYRRYPHKWGRLAEWLGTKPHHQLKWVLQDVSFEVSPGEALGVIGFNGAGKSTLLKIIAGTTRATTGSIDVGGRVAALLELGLGFHPDFTGRENAYMAGQLQGLRASEVAAIMPAIESFAGIGDYMDQPLRTYSSGMHVRLAFSVATAVRPDILIVDEALAVGDVLFQQKCFDRIREFRDAGTTLLFVSHSMPSVHSLCDRALLLHEGRTVIDGSVKESIDLFNALAVRARERDPAVLDIVGEPRSPSIADAGDDRAASAGRDDADSNKSAPRQVASAQAGSFSREGASIVAVRLLCDEREAEAFVSESTVTLQIVARFDAAYDDPHVGFQIRNSRGEVVFMTNTHCMGMRLGAVQPRDEVSVAFRFRAALAPGGYSVTAGMANGGLLEGFFREALSRTQDVRAFTVLRNRSAILWSGTYNLAPACTIQRSVVSVT
jgi:lipopolysaccharide transport system ATP-binding protein